MPRSRKSPQTPQMGLRTLRTSGSPKQRSTRLSLNRILMIVGGQGDYKKNSPPPLPRENAPEAGVQIRRRRNNISKGCAAQQLLPSLGPKKQNYKKKSSNWSKMSPILEMTGGNPQVMIETFVSSNTCSTRDCKIVSQTSPGFQIQPFGPKRPGFSKSPEVALTGYPPSPYSTSGMLNVPFLSTMRKSCQIENTVMHDSLDLPIYHSSTTISATCTSEEGALRSTQFERLLLDLSFQPVMRNLGEVLVSKEMWLSMHSGNFLGMNGVESRGKRFSVTRLGKVSSGPISQTLLMHINLRQTVTMSLYTLMSPISTKISPLSSRGSRKGTMLRGPVLKDSESASSMLSPSMVPSLTSKGSTLNPSILRETRKKLCAKWIT